MQDLYLNITVSKGYLAVRAEALCVSGIYDSKCKNHLDIHLFWIG